MWLSEYNWPSCQRRFGHQTIKYSAAPNSNGDNAVNTNYFTSAYMLNMGAVGSFEAA